MDSASIAEGFDADIARVGNRIWRGCAQDTSLMRLSNLFPSRVPRRPIALKQKPLPHLVLISSQPKALKAGKKFLETISSPIFQTKSR